jgi:hypothetical protein
MMLQNKHSARLQVVTSVTGCYWDMAQDGLVEMCRRKGGTLCLRIQVRLLEASVNLYHTHGIMYLLTYLRTYLLHGAESFLRS